MDRQLIWNKLKGVTTILRLVPLVAWTGGAFVVGTGLARQASGAEAAPSLLAVAALIAFLVHALFAHGLNDLHDWESGTDRAAAEVLSGGSDVLREGYLRPAELRAVAWSGFGLAVGLALLNPQEIRLLPHLAVGLWGSYAYSCPPWRLSYVPLAGEWIAALPTNLACGLAFYQLHGVEPPPLALAGILLHGILSLGWLMQHHLPDWRRDLEALPPKRTTVALVAARFGDQAARLVPTAYYLLASGLALWCVRLDRRFVISVATALLCAGLALWQDPNDSWRVARRELQMMGLTFLHAWLIAWL